MSLIGTQDYYLEVRRGNVDGAAMVSFEGFSTTMTTTRITVHPTGTTTDLDQSGIMATPATVKVASTSANDTSAGTGVRTLTLTGLDASGDEQSETITMNGQTAVTSANTYSAVTGIQGLTWGSGTKNAGTVWCGTGTFTAGVPATRFFAMGAGMNKGLTSFYVVPTGKTFYPRNAVVSIADLNKSARIFIETSSNGTNWITKEVYGVVEGSVSDILISNGEPVTAGQAVRITCLSDQANTVVAAKLEGVLIDD